MDFRHLFSETNAYMPPGRILGDLTEDDVMRRMAPDLNTIANLVAHMDFWQSWFLKRCRGEQAPFAAHAADGWPPVEDGSWVGLRERFLSGLEQAAALSAGGAAVLDARVDPAFEFPPMSHYTVREALVHLSMHNAHHLGQVITLRQLMGRWPPPDGSWTW